MLGSFGSRTVVTSIAVVGDHAAHPGQDLLGVVAGQHAAVDVGHRLGRDHVELLAAPQHVHGERGPHRWRRGSGRPGSARGRPARAASARDRRSRRPSPAGSTSATRRKYSCTSGSTRGGRSAASRRSSARTSRCGAVSGHGIEPCPGSPRAVSRRGSPVFSEITMTPERRAVAGVVLDAGQLGERVLGAGQPRGGAGRRRSGRRTRCRPPRRRWPGTRGRA